jgi:hypothetical protein
MFFAKRRWRRLMNILRPYQGRDALAHALKSDPLTPRSEKLGEVELICVVAHLCAISNRS